MSAVSTALRAACLLALALPLPTLAADCPSPPITEPLTCVASPMGLFYVRSAEDAERMAATAAHTSTHFEAVFGRPAPRGAVIETLQLDDEAALKHWQAQHRLDFTMPWINRELMQAALLEPIKSAIKAQQPELDESVLDALARQALAQASQKPDAGHHGLTMESILAHELGHMYLFHAFWPETEARVDAQHYGSPAPDWLDEIAAILMEDEAMTAQRRQQWRDMLRNSPERILPLETFFHTRHPLAELAARSTSKVTITLFNDKAIEGEAGFYLQARAVADFLIEHGQSPTIFASIAEAFAKQQSLADWLNVNGQRYGLPNDMNELEKHWQAWLAKKT